MALSRRGGRREALSIWPGFVDAMTALLLLLMFVLTIFMVVQFVLRETITTQDTELDALSGQVAGLADALGLEKRQTAGLRDDVAAARQKDDAQTALITSLGRQVARQTDALKASEAKITGFEAQVASLIADRDRARGEGVELTAQVADLEAARAKLVSDEEALQLALASARTEIDAKAEAARLDAAKREAVEALVADLRTKASAREASLTDALAALDAAKGRADGLAVDLAARTDAADAAERARLAEAAAAEALRARLGDASARIDDAERARLAEAAAAEALRDKLKGADAELTAMTLNLEAQRKRAEDTLTLLAAADAAKNELGDEVAEALAAKLAAEGSAARQETEAERQAALLAMARQRLAGQSAQSTEAQRRVAVLNAQLGDLKGQLASLNAALGASEAKAGAKDVQIENLGSRLNQALALTAAEQKKRADLEEAERKRLESETQDLAKYRSEFFGQLRQVLAGIDGVKVVGDRFVFSSEVLFQPASAELSQGGRDQITQVAAILERISSQIPPGIDWIIRVDGHTDDTPLSGSGAFPNNWALSQARALSVVLYMTNVLDFPPNRLAATGFGEYQPVETADTPEARAANRRIELKLTER